MNNRLESAKHRYTSAYVVLNRLAPQLHKPAPPQQRGLLPYISTSDARYTPVPRRFTPQIYVLRIKRWFNRFWARFSAPPTPERIPASQSSPSQERPLSPYTTTVMPNVAARSTQVLPALSPYETQFLPTLKQAEEIQNRG